MHFRKIKTIFIILQIIIIANIIININFDYFLNLILKYKLNFINYYHVIKKIFF